MDERIRRASELEAEAKRLREDYASNPPTVVRTPYLVEHEPGEYSVGAKDEHQWGDFPYNGPCARVHGDQDWVYVCTDDYEGNAMINREALPQLIEALQRLEAHLQNAGRE